MLTTLWFIARNGCIHEAIDIDIIYHANISKQVFFL